MRDANGYVHKLTSTPAKPFGPRKSSHSLAMSSNLHWNSCTITPPGSPVCVNLKGEIAGVVGLAVVVVVGTPSGSESPVAVVAGLLVVSAAVGSEAVLL